MWWLWALIGVGALGLVYSAGYEVRAFTVRRVTLPLLPPASRPLRILHLSDLHLTPRQGRKARWLRSLIAERPDLVIVTGDFIAHAESVPAVLAALEPLRAYPGAFVFGSNDYYGPRLKNPVRYLLPDDGTRIHGADLPWQDLRDALVASGWHDLTHARLTDVVAGMDIELRGVDDPHLERDRYDEVRGPVGAAAVTIGVTHAPYRRVLDAMEADGIELILAGHTHGGQLCIPGFGALVTNCDLDRRRAKGLHRHGRAWLHVSAGCGTNPYTPVRFACRPEATLLTLMPGY